MRLTRRASSWLVAGLACTSTATAGEIRGRVLLGGRPAGGVAISALAFEDGDAAARREARHEEARPLASTSTRPDGSFLLAVAEPAGTALQVACSGGGTPALRFDPLVDAAGADLGELRLPAGAPLAGRVVDERGLPVVGATITLWAGRGRLLERLPFEPTPQATVSGPDGSFRFQTAGAEGNTVRVEAPGFATAERSGVRAGALTRPLRLALGQVLRGVVLLPDGRLPVAGALVRFEGQAHARPVETRADGSFVLEGRSPEAGMLVAEAGERGRGVLALAAGAAGTVTVVLAPPASLGGRVVEADSGRPVAGVRLLLRGDAGARTLLRSGPDGRYLARGLAPQRYTLSVEDERFVPWTRALTLAAGRAEAQDLALVHGATLTGRVVGERGEPVAGASLRLGRSGENVFRSFVRTIEGGAVARSAVDGSFRATRLAPGDGQRLDVTHEEYEERALGGISLVAGATRSGLTVVMRRGLSLRGVVRDAEGRPVAGAEVTLSRSRSIRAGRGGAQISLIGPGSEVRREAGPDGRFEFRGLSPGDYTVSARASGFARAAVDPVNVSETSAGQPIELSLRPGAAISGYVRDRAGAGAAGWYVSARPSAAPGPALGPATPRTEEATGADGLFVLEGLGAGESYDLQLLGPPGLGPRRAGVVAPADGLEIAVPGTGSIRGHVVEAENGHAVQDFELRYEPDARGGTRFVMRVGPGGGRGPYEPQSLHAEDGSFTLDGVPAGRWTLRASARGYQPGTVASLAVTEGEAVDGVELRLSRGAVVSGRVLDGRGGRPVAGATVRARLSGGGPTMERFSLPGEGGDDDEAMSDADGRYEIAGLAPGTWTLTASHPDWSDTSANLEVKEAAASLDLRLGRGAAVAGVVLAGGRAVPGAQVTLSAAGEAGFGMGAGMPGGDEQSALTDDAGRFRFERLPAGRYSLVATLRSQSSAPVEAAVTADADQQVQLSLAEGAHVTGVVSGLPEAQLAGVGVSAQARDYFASTRTAAGGVFELPGVPDGTLSLNANAGDLLGSSRTASATVAIAPGQAEATAEIVFAQGFRVDGHVTRGGQPVTDATVMAFPDAPGRRSAGSRTDESGAFALEGLDEGQYTITAVGQQGAPIRKTLTLTGDTTVELEAPPARLAGSVVEAGSGRPLPDVAVRVEDAAGGQRIALAAATDGGGRFQIEELEPKSYQVSFQKPAYEVETRELTAGDDDNVRVELRRGEGLAIEARDGVFGTPLRGLFVRVLDAGGAAVFSGGVTLDSDGRGEVPAVKPGGYQLRAESSGYATVDLPALTVPQATPLALVLTPGGSLEIAIGPQTLALPEPTALLLRADGRPCLWNAFTPDGTIRLSGPTRRLENVPPGRYTLQVAGDAGREVTVAEGGISAVALP
ncbi:MAG TPA: carboxypeptidase-like regulatory domain-containing protein [Vicinamibacteria bacterium]|nr:carboxypeptidase-like regulatory domain-containing protein [Vicinamibacteria bacterium]